METRVKNKTQKRTKIQSKISTMNNVNFHLLISLIFGFSSVNFANSADDLSTIEPEASTGCPTPDLRFATTRRADITTETPFAQFETTQIYLPEDFTTSDIEFVEKSDPDSSNGNGNSNSNNNKNNNPDDSGRKYAEVNPYRIDPLENSPSIASSSGNGGGSIGLHEIGGVEEDDSGAGSSNTTGANGTANAAGAGNRRRNKKRRFTGGRRRRLENENGSSGRSGRNRYERHAIYKRESFEPDFDDTELDQSETAIQPPQQSSLLSSSSVSSSTSIPLHSLIPTDLSKPTLPTMMEDVYYIEIADLVKSNIISKNTKKKMHKSKKKKKNSKLNKMGSDKIISKHYQEEEQLNPSENQHNQGEQNQEQEKQDEENNLNKTDLNQKDNHQEEDEGLINQFYANETLGEFENGQNSNGTLQRVKRKSGKTTGALSRPKPGGDSGSKSVSRKEGRIFNEAGGEGDGHALVHPDEEEEEEEEESEETEYSHFMEVSEIRFPGEVGPLGDRRLCKIRCVKGKWVGPLCATNEEDDHGHIKFQPLYKSCHVNRIPPHLLLSYRNISVSVGWDLPHGHSLQARCKDLGLYKLLGESRVLCSNGLWAPRMPSCVPTTLLTNFSDDSPPSIRIKIGSGSGAFEPSGVLAVLPASTIHLDCMYPRRRGNPEWTWTGWFKQYYTGWSTLPDEKATKYRLTIKDIQNQDSGTFTCASPRGLTNSIPIMVATSECPRLPDPTPPLSLRLEGNKLGHRALYRCPLGYRIEGTANSTCLASGNWSAPPPTCNSVQCPPLYLEDPHLSLTELNTSAWGRAVFKCSWGFRLSGPPGLECEPTGQWSGPVPRCRAIQCPTPLVPINGRIDGTSGSSSHRRYAVGALVTFSCTEGHILVGEASIVCTETGFWSHPPPFCKSQCPYPGDPPNGLIAPLKFHYDPGDLLSVQCRPGFVEFSPSGPPERPRCLPDGNWSGPVPQCRSYEEV